MEKLFLFHHQNPYGHKKISDRVGQKFNKLTAVRHSGSTIRGDRLFIFKCDCGKEVERVFSAVKTGRIKSRGCGSNSKGDKYLGKKAAKIREDRREDEMVRRLMEVFEED